MSSLRGWAARLAILLTWCPAGVGQGSIQAVVTGHANDFLGVAIVHGDVGLINMRSQNPGVQQVSYKFPLDAQGNYRGVGIAPGTFAVVLKVNGKLVDYVEDVNLRGAGRLRWISTCGARSTRRG